MARKTRTDVDGSASHTLDGFAGAVLTPFGVTQPAQLPLLLPVGYDDFSRPWTQLSRIPLEEPVHVLVTPIEAPTRAGSGIPRVRFRVRDADNAIDVVTIFGDEPDLGKQVEVGTDLLMTLVAKEKGGTLYLTCKELVDPRWRGRVRPSYPGRKAGDAREKVRLAVSKHLAANIAGAERFVASHLERIAPVDELLACVGCAGWTLGQIISETHRPSSYDYGVHARRAYLELAALGAIERSQGAGPPPPPAIPFRLTTLHTRIAQLHGTPTGDQSRAMESLADLLARDVATRAILAADVGTGKSWVAEVLAASMADAGGRTLIMAPTYPLALQLANEFARLFPDVPSALVAEGTVEAEGAAATVVVGTSAVLTRDLGQFAFVIVDEQQRWSRGQREHYVTGATHLLEMSATCIPRTQALIRFGKVSVVQMRETHAVKEITTYLWEGAARDMFVKIREARAAGRPIMVIYPKRESTDDAPKGKRGRKKKEQPGAIDDRHSIEQAVPRWEALYPGRVRAMTGDDDNATKAAGLRDIEKGRADILLTTTVVEVGISLSNLFDIVIVHPDRYGVTTLHQLRGRVARNGGKGYCHLWCPAPVSAKTRARLDAVVRTTDGFALAEEDLRQRGTGDLGAESATQSGADETLLYGAPMTMDLIDDVMPMWDYFHPEMTEPAAKTPA